MKKLFFLSLCAACMMGHGLYAQTETSDSNSTKKNKTTITEEDEGPIMLKFEPDYVAEQLKRRNAILEKRRMIDTMDISEKKKLRLIKELYRDLNSKRLQKVLLAETKFEDELDK